MPGFPAIRVYYRVMEDVLRVIRILHGERDIHPLLESADGLRLYRIYSLGFQHWANSFRVWLIPMTLKERVLRVVDLGKTAENRESELAGLRSAFGQSDNAVYETFQGMGMKVSE